MNSIEEKLWSYIDGTCSAEEREQITRLIDRDAKYKSMYAGLMQLNAEFNSLELDEPPMAFTYNIMEQIRKQEASTPLKAEINKYIIRAISIFFIGSILLLLGFALGDVNWNTGHGGIHLPQLLKLSGSAKLFIGFWIKGSLLFDIILGLFLLDAQLRKRTDTNNGMFKKI